MAESQLAIPFEDGRQPLTMRYRDWRATAEGVEVVRMAEDIGTNLVAGGTRRLSISLIWEQIRKLRKKSADNSFRAFVARELHHRHPEWPFIMRKQKAAA